MQAGHGRRHEVPTMALVDARLVDDPSEFLSAAAPLLLSDEARHNLILGLAGTLRDHPDVYPAHRLWLVEAAGRPVAAALRTPPQKLVLAQPSADGALQVLATAIFDDLPGVVGAVPEAGVFSAAWSAQTGMRDRVRRRQGIYALHRVLPPSGVSGSLRLADERDRDLLVRWWSAFVVEALADDDPDESSIEASI